MEKRKKTIYTSDIPKAFWEWYEEIYKEYGYATIEITNSEIMVIRTKTPVEDKKVVKDLAFGKLIRDASGYYLERTFRVKYDEEKDEISF